MNPSKTRPPDSNSTLELLHSERQEQIEIASSLHRSTQKLLQLVKMSEDSVQRIEILNQLQIAAIDTLGKAKA